MSIEWFITFFIISLSPGIGVVYILSATLGGGWRAGFQASVGCTIAIVIHLMVDMAALAAVLHTSAVLFQTIKFSGVPYLLWMAWAILNDRGDLSVTLVTSVTSMRLVSRVFC